MIRAKALCAATVLLAVATLAGVALAAGPFVLAYQPLGNDWIQATKHHVVTGVIVAAVMVMMLLSVPPARLRRSRMGVGFPR